MDKKEITEVLEKHEIWLEGKGNGERAELGGVDLRGADLRGAYLRIANLRGANLEKADLRRADLRIANLRKADLGWAILSGADLSGACLREANLGGVDLSGADLREANLRGACLRDADLRGADLSGAYLGEADLRGADLSGEDLYGADLEKADLRDAKMPEKQVIIPEGKFIMYKKLRNGTIACLEVPAYAKRVSTWTSNKIRVSEAVVLSGEGVSNYDDTFYYAKGKLVKPKEAFNEDDRIECASGIHGFLTKEGCH